jgi:hypothetical protein
LRTALASKQRNNYESEDDFMPAKTFDEAKQVVLNALPASGEVEYEEFYNSLQAAGERVAVRNFHNLRKAGDVVARVDPTTGKLYVSRPSA